MSSGGLVFVGNEAGKLYAWDVEDGSLFEQGFPVELDLTGYSLARQNLTGISSPAVTPVEGDDYLVFGCDNGRLYRLNLRTHRLEEGYVQLGSCIESSPAIHAEYAYVGITAYLENCFFKVDVNTFAPPLGTELPNECRATPALRPGTGDPPTPDAAFVGVDTGDTFHKLRLSDLGAAYEPAFDVNVGTPQHFVGSAAIAGGVVFVGNDNGRLYALRAEPLPAGDPPLPPEQRWQAGNPEQLSVGNMEGYVCSSPALSANADSEGNLWLFVTTRAGGGVMFAYQVHAPAGGGN